MFEKRKKLVEDIKKAIEHDSTESVLYRCALSSFQYYVLHKLDNFETSLYMEIFKKVKTREEQKNDLLKRALDFLE